jgi:hypothetical protein
MARFGQVGRSPLSTVGYQQVDDLSRSSVLFRHSQGRRADAILRHTYEERLGDGEKRKMRSKSSIV